jgi:hypothetical protein
LALRAVCADSGATGFEFGETVSKDDPIEIWVAERSLRCLARDDEKVVTDTFALDDSCKGNRVTRSHPPRELV